VKIVLTIVHFLLIILAVYALEKRAGVTNRKLFWLAFIFHLVAGLSVGVVYTYYYSANDTWQFFADAEKLSAIAHNDFFSYLRTLFSFGENLNISTINQDLRSIFFIKIISVFCWLSMDSYWVCAGYFSLLAFVASWQLHNKITVIFQDSELASALAFLFFPSIVFWSSGLEKEALALSCIYFLSAVFLSIMTNEKIGKLYWPLILITCWIVWSLKYYWVAVFFISSATSFATKLISTRFSWSKEHPMGTWIILLVVLGAITSFSHPNFYPADFLEMIISNHKAFTDISMDNNLIHFYHLQATWTSVIINMPWAIVSGIFRPFIGEGHGLLGLIASVENLFILLLFVTSLGNAKKTFQSPWKLLVFALLSYCVVLCVFLALSTPNFGTLSRYRVGFLPFLVFVFAYRNPLLGYVKEKLSSGHQAI